MPTLTPVQLVHLQELCRKHRVEFLGEIDPSDWPECHKDTLNGIKEVASKEYDAYATNPALLGTDPWKMERKSHAMVLVKSAVRSRGRNENTWRHACESFILSRLSSEVCWLEAVGLNQIFNFRADEEVHHDPEVTKSLGKRENPDRVYGLRKTRNIELLLYDIATEGHNLRFMDQPMNAKGDQQLFPFLVLEAKAGSSVEWLAINMQTAFSIRTFLETQRQLYDAASARSDWCVRPMVWFFSNKGENWRLCAAYTEEAPLERDCFGTTVYRVIDVWHGCITTRNGALQLLLLVDYLFDWARDRYREDIIRALRIVARGGNDAASGIYTDTDIFSTVPLDSIFQASQVTAADNDLNNYISAQSSFLALDSPAGVCRHASFVESRYYCLYITADNVRTFLQSATQSRVQPLCRLILRHLSQSILIDSATIEAIEEEWTGVSRLSAPPYRPQAQEQFHVAMSFTTYLSSQWHQVRELSIIAITRDAWKDIGTASGFKRKLRTPNIFYYYNTNELVQMVKKLRAGSPRQVLHAAITRTAYRIAANRIYPRGLTVEVDGGSLRDLVYFIYAWLKRGGALEPNESFLRTSKTFEQQHLREDHVDPFPLIKEDGLQASDEGCVLITATPSDIAGGRIASICAYLTEGDSTVPASDVLANIVKKALETRDVYHTTRSSDRGTNFSDLIQQGQSGDGLWNIRGSYGIYSENFNFLKMLAKLGGSEPPVTLGASRSPDSCGSQLYRRNLSPWLDKRYIYMDSQSRMFILHKLFVREILFWKGIAKERERSGVPCCQLCAALGERSICITCEDFLADDNQYDWLKNAVLGKPPLQMKNLSEDEVKTRLRTMRDDYPALREDIAPRPLGYRGYNGNIDWAKKLDFYSKLDEPFNDIVELACQWRQFCRYCDKNGPYYNFQRNQSRKRKRSENSDAEETDNSSINRETSDEDTSDTSDVN